MAPEALNESDTLASDTSTFGFILNDTIYTFSSAGFVAFLFGGGRPKIPIFAG